MATLAKTSPGGRETSPGGRLKGVATGQQLVDALRPWSARLAMQKVLRWAAGGASAGLLLACLFLLLSRFFPWAAAPYWAVAMVAVCLLCALAFALYHRPSPARSARLLDMRLGLRDRLSTAWELRDNSASLPALQRRDALRKLNEFTPAGAIQLWPGRARMLTLALLIVAFALLLLLPNPQGAGLQQQEAFQDGVSRQVASIGQLRKVAALAEILDGVMRVGGWGGGGFPPRRGASGSFPPLVWSISHARPCAPSVR